LRRFKIYAEEYILLLVSIIVLIVSQFISYLKINNYIYILIILPVIILISTILRQYSKYLSSLSIFLILSIFLPRNYIQDYYLVINIILFYIGFFSELNIEFSIKKVNFLYSILSIVLSLGYYFLTENKIESILLFFIINTLINNIKENKVNLLFLVPAIIIYFVKYTSFFDLLNFMIILFILFIFIEVYELFLSNKISFKIIIFFLGLIIGFYHTYVSEISIYLLGVFTSYFFKSTLFSYRKIEKVRTPKTFTLGILLYITMSNYLFEYYYIPLILSALLISYLITKQKLENKIQIELIIMFTYILSTTNIKYIILFTLLVISMSDIIRNYKDV